MWKKKSDIKTYYICIYCYITYVSCLLHKHTLILYFPQTEKKRKTHIAENEIKIQNFGS